MAVQYYSIALQERCSVRHDAKEQIYNGPLLMLSNDKRNDISCRIIHVCLRNLHAAQSRLPPAAHALGPMKISFGFKIAGFHASLGKAVVW